MPPKRVDPNQKKASQAKKAKAAVDKTFGMKNKNKSKKVQQHIQRVQQEANQMSLSKEEQKKKQQRAAEKPFGVDPKTIVCEFFRASKCTKGNRCKVCVRSVRPRSLRLQFSHDLNVERKVAKRSMYVDTREQERQEKEADTMDQWDDDKLSRVVKSKQSNENLHLPTKIVCKHFLAAIEERKYGWFWECPNGGKKCMYRHALPPGYVLKSERKKQAEEAAAGPTLEELIERERAKIGEGTPITIETFTAWKRRKVRDQQREAARAAEMRTKALADGSAKMSGREAFSFDPTLFGDDDEADDALPDFSDDEDDETPDNTADTGAGDDENAKVWDETSFKLADLDEDDPEGDELDAVAYARLVAKRLGISMQQRKDPAASANSDDDEDGDADNGGSGNGGDDGDDDDDEQKEDSAAEASTSDAKAANGVALQEKDKEKAEEAKPAKSTTADSTASTSNVAKSDAAATTASTTTTTTTAAAAAPAAAPINADLFAAGGDVDELPDDFSDDDE